MESTRRGPLAGLTVIELAALGPVPFAGMHLAQLGAEVVLVTRPTVIEAPFPAELDPFNADKRPIRLDLKSASGRDRLLELVGGADVLLEGHRPGVMERLGLGPDTIFRHNPRIVIGRMTGWGQTGPWAHRAGHDINYLALTGALNAIGPREGPPSVPLNIVGDYGGGALYLLVGVLAAIREVDHGGTGQVVDASIVDGVAHMLSGVYAGLGPGYWTNQRQSNAVDGGAPYYGVYRTQDEHYVAVSAGERRFYRALVHGLGVSVDLDEQQDRTTWDRTKQIFAEAFRGRTLDEWLETFADSDACVSPVLDLVAAIDHPQIRARRTLSVLNGVLRAAAAPRFSRWHTDDDSRSNS